MLANFIRLQHVGLTTEIYKIFNIFFITSSQATTDNMDSENSPTESEEEYLDYARMRVKNYSIYNTTTMYAPLHKLDFEKALNRKNLFHFL